MILLLIKNSQYFTIMKSTKFIINRTHVHNWSTHYIEFLKGSVVAIEKKEPPNNGTFTPV